MNINEKQNEEYVSMINYLISNLNKAKISPSSLINQNRVIPIFLYEFFVFELYLPRELLKVIKQPILAFRLLDFPTLTLEGNVNYKKETVFFSQGKSSFFEMDLNELKDSLINQPMYIMFLDLNHGNMKIIGNCRLNISIFAYDSFLNYGNNSNSKIPSPRRNIIELYDNSMEKVAEFEMSLLIRREYYKFDKNVEITEKTKSYIIKKAKKSTDKNKYVKSKNEQFIIKGEKENKNYMVYDNKNVKDNVDINQVQQQYINNFILEGKDKAFNAHPVNKVINIGPQPQSGVEPQNNNKKKKGKKKKVTKRSIKTETDLIPGVDVPINKVDYYKKSKSNSKKKVHKPNNSELINSMYNKYNNNLHYNFPNTNYGKFNDNNTNNNYYSKGNTYYNNNNNFNNNYYSKGNTYYNNNKNINDNFLFYESNRMNMNNKNSPNQNQYINQQPNNIIQNNNYINPNISNNLSETLNSDTNEYLKLISEIKSKVGSYKEKLLNEQNNIKQIKMKRNINTNLDNNLINSDKDNQNSNINNNNIIIDNKNYFSENNNNENNFNDNDFKNNENDFNNDNKLNNNSKNNNEISFKESKEDINNNENNNNIKDENNDNNIEINKGLDLNNNFNEGIDNNNENINNDINENNYINEKENVNNEINEDINNNKNKENTVKNTNNLNPNKFSNINNDIIEEIEENPNDKENETEKYSDFENIDEIPSKINPNVGSTENFVTTSININQQSKTDNKNIAEKQNAIIEEQNNDENDEYKDDFDSIHEEKNEIQEVKEEENKNESNIPEEPNIKNENSEIPEESYLKKETNIEEKLNKKQKPKAYSESIVQSNYNFTSKRSGAISEYNNSSSNNNNNAESNAGYQNMGSGEIVEEINENIDNNETGNKNSKKEVGSDDTNLIEELLESKN